jgi:hypothetical protein
MSREVGCAVVRDASYLNWKYVDQPGQLFHRLAVLEGGAVQAVAVWMMREADEHYRYRRAFLVDLVVPPSQNELVLRAIEAVCEAAAGAGADAVTCMHVGGWLTQALRQSGFLIRTPERFLLVLPGGLPPEARDAVLTESSWYATQGDSDIDRP